MNKKQIRRLTGKLTNVKKSGIFLFFLLIISMKCTIVNASDELYFDSSGNLIFETRDLKATSGVRYKTVGWVIKRYDMALNAPGQQYVIVQKTTDGPSVTDPHDPRYVLSNFKTDADEILDAVGKCSTAWRYQLENYGDLVYIDSVMAVVVNGRLQGNVEAGGVITGTVYMTYEGIAGARPWADKKGLKSYYNIKVRYNPVIKDPKWETVEEKETYTETSRNISMDFRLGSYRYNNEKFNVSEGIPSGETLYLQGKSDKYLWNISYRKVSGKKRIPVMVYTDYVLKWIDYQGIGHEEEKTIQRYYMVERDYEYKVVERADVYRLSEGCLSGTAMESDYFGFDDEKSKLTIERGGGKISGEDSIVSCYYGKVKLYGNGVKPDIYENENQVKSFAESQIGKLSAKSDRVWVDGKDIVSLNGYQVILKEGINIPVLTENGCYTDQEVKLIYENVNNTNDKKTYIYNRLNSVNVHTPVCISGKIKGDKKENQAVNPCENDLVTGEEAVFYMSSFGNHRDIMGYGMRDYSKYTGCIYMSCPFDIIYEGKKIPGKSPVKLSGKNGTFIVPCDTKEGEYTIDFYAYGINSDGIPEKNTELINENMEPGANLSVKSRGAYCKIPVRVIGKMENFTIKEGENVRTSHMLPLEEENIAGKTYDIQMEVYGDSPGDNDHLKVEYTYLVKNEKTGKYVPVWLYEIINTENKKSPVLVKVGNEKIIDGKDAVCQGEKTVFSWKLDIPREFIIVDEGTERKDIIKNGTGSFNIYNRFYRGSQIVVGIYITYEKDNKPYMTYENQMNYKRGYCNRWEAEKFSGEYRYGILLGGTSENTFFDYRVTGTH